LMRTRCIASLPGGAATRKKEVLAGVACKDLGLWWRRGRDMKLL